MAAPVTKIGFVGLGRMGGAMAGRFLAAGYPVYGTSRSRGRVEPLIAAGLSWRATAREVAEVADVVFTSIPDDTALGDVASGPKGILAGLTAGKTWVDMSTVSPQASRELAARVRASGARMVDAPVSGSVPLAQAGTLTIMVGGDEDVYTLVEPLLRELGTPAYIGENGQGLVVKLAINVSLAVQMLAFSEGLLLAERSGVDRQRALDVMGASAIGSPMLRARQGIILDPPDEAWFDVGFMRKDVELALDAAQRLEIPLPTAERADEVLERARALGYERHDIAALLQVLEELAPERSEGGVTPHR